MEDGIQIKKHLPHDYAVCRVNNLSFLLKQETGHFENMRDILGFAVAHSHSGIATINDPRIKFGRYLSMSLSFGIPCSIRGFFIHDCILSFLQDRAWIFVKGKSKCKRFFYFIPERPLHLFGLWESLVAVRYQLQTKDGSFGRKAYTPHLRCPTWLLILPLFHEATEKTEG